MSFCVGQQVVCVNVDFSREPTWRRAVRAFPVLNSVYTIRSICEEDGLIGFCFHEIVNPPAHFSRGYAEPAFDSRRFRPAKKTSIEVFEKILASVDRKTERKTPERV